MKSNIAIQDRQTQWIALCAEDSVGAGDARRVLFRKRPLAVFKLDGEFHVTDDTCTHGMASQAGGELDACVVTCSWHRGSLDVRSGDAISEPCTIPLTTYPCTVRDGMIVVQFSE